MYFLDLALTGLIFTAPILIYRFVMKKDKVEKKKAFGLAFLCGICGYIICSLITIGIYGQVANPSTLGIWTVIDWLILGDFKKKENASTHEEKVPSPPTESVNDWMPTTSYASDEEATLNEEASTQDAEDTELVTQITSFEYTDDC